MKARWFHLETSPDEICGVGLLFAFITFIGALDDSPWWLWLVCASSFAAALAAWTQMQRRWRREHRQILAALGKCGSCGYDLYGNVSGLCPECGCRRQGKETVSPNSEVL